MSEKTITVKSTDVSTVLLQIRSETLDQDIEVGTSEARYIATALTRHADAAEAFDDLEVVSIKRICDECGAETEELKHMLCFKCGHAAAMADSQMIHEDFRGK
jgi:hypothetical protein